MKNIKENFVTDAINIRSYPLGDYDNIVVMYSKDQGLIKAIAKGAKRPKSKLGARMQSLVANKIMLKGGRTFDTICEASSLNTFTKLRGSLDKLTYSMYLSEIINLFCKPNDSDVDSKEVYELLYGALQRISSATTEAEILLPVIKFQLQFMELQGYGLELSNCAKCQCEIKEDALFSLNSNGTYCVECQNRYDSKIKLHKKIREFLISQQNSKIEDSTPYDTLVDENFCNKCFLFLKKYITTITNRESKSIKVLEAIS